MPDSVNLLPADENIAELQQRQDIAATEQQSETEKQTKTYIEQLSELFNANMFGRSFAFGLFLIIAFGQFNDTVDLGLKAWEWFYSSTSEQPYYNKLSNIHVNSTRDHLYEVMGQPLLSKDLGQDQSIEYFIEKHHVTGVIHDGERISGFYVLALEDYFTPQFKLPNLGTQVLGAQPLAALSEHRIVNILPGTSRTQNYYIETYDLSSEGLYFDFYQGRVALEEPTTRALINELSDALLLGDDHLPPLRRLRAELKPNLAGYGHLDEQLLSKIFLSPSELYLFGQDD